MAFDVHHKTTHTELNVNYYDVSMRLDNLECLCRKCHNQETHKNEDHYIFNENGDLIDK